MDERVSVEASGGEEEGRMPEKGGWKDRLNWIL